MPNSITIEISGHSSIELVVKEGGRDLSGVSVKNLFQDVTGREYYVKEPKLRDVRAIFKNDVFFHELLFRRWELLGEGDFEPVVELPSNVRMARIIESLSSESLDTFEQIQVQIRKYVQHVDDLVLSNVALEVLASRLSTAIMGDLLVAPANYLHLHEGKPMLISPSVGNLEEFLSKSLAEVKSPDYWLSHKAPSFVELVKTEDEARILGQAYFVALLFGHYDVVNNINLSNFGYVRGKDGGLTLSIVDWGNCLGVGFSGFSADESAFNNPQFKGGASLNSLPEYIMGFQHVMPLDKVVYPLLPRQVVPNLFDLTATDQPILRAAQRLGFYEACDQAMGVLWRMHEIVPEVVKQTYAMAMSAEDARKVEMVLPDFIRCDALRKDDGSSLADIIVGRIKSLALMKRDLQAGRSLEDIADERLMIIKQGQMFSSLRFFPMAKSRKHESEPLKMEICLG